ncbi:hypothetical protein HZ989_14770 [Brevundimonas sp. AJA228-03]|uniref:hypothetical protein n=1 Tax=Brevundimonas sp. AJA228-03 TaxID=2752515 RepID=UPI001AE0C6F6|nr:hypothetical protein [Brevundimonas sp. AJA228-03]QTN19452.1 hypothetical protein HZ989_14770 [Brevundimonas sp. AJA228-03]
MTRAYVEAPATHFRLKPETWAIIAEEYRNGATAKDIGAKWKVAPSSVYRYACRDGWTKKGMGDARARAHARMVEEEEASVRSMQPVGSRALKALFQPAPVDDASATDPAELARAATLASGRAMKGRLWNEAKALAGLAETYARLAEREAKSAEAAKITIETIDLQLLFDILVTENDAARARFCVEPDGPDTESPTYPLRKRFARIEGAKRAAVSAWRMDNLRRMRRLEALVRELGGEVPERDEG